MTFPALPRASTRATRRLHGAVLVLLTLCGAPPATAATAAPAPDSPTVFVDVNVVPMDAERVLRHVDVRVDHGRIAAIAPHLAIPAGARVVEGHGTAFLSPGLADMHSHADTAEDMKVYLANGVTSVLNMGEASNAFLQQVRPAIHRGAKPGPHVYAALLVDGTPRYGHFTITTPDEARWIVRLAKTNGYDFIKVYNNLSPECFDALIDEGRAQHLAVVGHGVTRVGLQRQLEAGQVLVAHAEEFLYTVFSNPDDPQDDRAPDAARIPGVVAMVKRSGGAVTADLATYGAIARQWGRPDVLDGFMRMPEVRYLAPPWRIAWQDGDYTGRSGSLDAKLAFLRRFVKALQDGGVPLVAGTDAPTIPGLVPGFSLHEDLHALQEAGLTPYEALATATRNAGGLIARSVAGAEPFGTIRPGQRADLILSEGNPLDDLSTLRTPLGVMAQGRWHDRADLQALLDVAAARYARAFPR